MKHVKLYRPISSVLFTLICAPALQAEVIVDDSINPNAAGTIAGPNFQITADLGVISGNNLFHSFDTFNLSSSETATFRGPVGGGTVNNVVSRVTGGGVSTIDGAIVNSVPGADFWFINPNGVVFGQNASIDTQGSFYVSTGDYIRFNGGEQFNATIGNEVFSSASPEAFGFVTSNPASITVVGSALGTQSLSIPEGERFALVGGDIDLAGEELSGTTNALVANSGEIDLVAAASAGEVDLSSPGITDTLTAYGDITIDTYSLDVSAANSTAAAGSIYIKGDQFVMVSSAGDSTAMSISSNTVDGDGGSININAVSASVANSQIEATVDNGSSDFIGSDININAGNLTLNPDGVIRTESTGTATGGNINITTNPGTTTVTGLGAKIQTHASGPDSIAGDINISTDTLNVSNLGLIETTMNYFDNTIPLPWVGRVGHITITADNSVNINNGTILSEMFGPGSAPNTISITTNTLNLDNFGFIISDAFNTVAQTGSGTGSSIDINASSAINMSNLSGIISESGDGTGGNIVIDSTDLNMKSGSLISSVTSGGGNSGDVSLTLGGQLLMDTASMNSSTQGTGGNFFIIALDAVSLYNSSITTTSPDNSNNGNIGIDSDVIALNRSTLSTSATTNAGNITLDANRIVASLDSTLDIDSLTEIPEGLISLEELSQDIPEEPNVNAPIVSIAALLKQRCAAQSLQDRSSFVVGNIYPLAPAPDSYQSSDMVAFENTGQITLGAFASIVPLSSCL